LSRGRWSNLHDPPDKLDDAAIAAPGPPARISHGATQNRVALFLCPGVLILKGDAYLKEKSMCRFRHPSQGTSRMNIAGCRNIALTGAALAVMTGLSIVSAEARIRCDGAFQVIAQGERIATPYCEDQYLAVVAQRSYGVSTSGNAVRHNVHEKERVCRIIGHDARVNDICLQYLPGRGRDYTR